MEETVFLLYHFYCTICCSFFSDIDISKQQMPKKIAEVAKEATILDYEVTLFMNYDKGRTECDTEPLNKIVHKYCLFKPTNL